MRDPGYYLVGRGRRAFESAIGYRKPFWRAPGRWSTRRGAGPYVTAHRPARGHRAGDRCCSNWSRTTSAAGALALLGALGLFPALDASVAFVNRAVTTAFRATILPGLALREGVPPQFRTFVVVPTLLTTPESIEEEIERLEIHYLASPEGEMHFALLSDWVDAATEHTPGDEELLAIAAQGIARLNRRYGPAPAGDRFLLLHRRRVWCDVQRQWMGWERKRGKLHELNRLLRGASDTTFLDVDGAGARRTDRSPLRHHAGRRHEAAARNGPPVDRQAVAPAQPPQVRRRNRTRGRWLRRAAAASHAVAADRSRGLDLPAHRLERARPRPVCGRRLRRVPGSLRRRLLCREGNLRHRCIRGGARGSRRGRNPAQPRPVRGNLCARRTRVRHRGRRGISRAL